MYPLATQGRFSRARLMKAKPPLWPKSGMTATMGLLCAVIPAIDGKGCTVADNDNTWLGIIWLGSGSWSESGTGTESCIDKMGLRMVCDICPS